MASKIDTIRDTDGQLPVYAWPGGYPLFYVGVTTYEHGSTVFGQEQGIYCPACANQPDADPKIVAYEVNYEDPDLYCDGCGKRIESAYAEDND